MKTLMPHQKKALRYAKKLSHIALFMEMRLGKTLVAIHWAEHWKCKRILVVAPKSVLPTWREELLDEQYAEQDIMTIEGDEIARRMKALHTHSTWFIVNYEALLYSPEILEIPWDCIILDESTRIRIPTTSTTKLLINNTSTIPCKAILTGLPCPESEKDYVEQIRFLNSHFMHCSNFWIWRHKYCSQFGDHNWVVSSSLLPTVKAEVNQIAFTMTRKEAGIGSKKIYEKRYVEFTPQQKKVYDQVTEDFAYELEKETKTTKYIPVQYTWLAQIASGFTSEGQNLSREKLNEIRYLLQNDLRGEPIVIWFRHNNEIKFVRTELRSAGFKVSSFTGDNKDDVAFKKGDTQILCAQAKCGMMGLDWSIASTAIYYSNWYDGEIRQQSEDRIIHPKKKEPLLYIDLICKDSIDEYIVQILREKKVTSRYFNFKLDKLWRKHESINHRR